MKEDKYIIYEHLFPNGKKYIGITCREPKKRWKGGLYGYAHNQYMQNAIKKYGWKNIEHKILQTNLTKEEAENEEIRLIELYKLTDRRYGYNLEKGGKGSNRISEETRQKLREKCSGKNNARYGVEVTQETREKMRQAKLGTKQTDEHRFNIMRGEGKKTAQYDLDGNFIKEWHSTREARRELHIYGIDKCCRGVQKTAGGFLWKYV